MEKIIERNRGSFSLCLWRATVFFFFNVTIFLIVCSPESYLGNSDIWDICEEPENIVVFNIGLFSALLVAACLELLLCGFQVLNGLFGCICGTCNHKEVCTLDTKVTSFLKVK